MALWISFSNERDPPEINVEPRVRLHSWRIFRSVVGDFFIGAQLGRGTLRLTSALLRMDFVTAIATTSSGREYEFFEPPTANQISQSLIAANALRRGLHGAIDVSELWWQAIMHGVEVLPAADWWPDDRLRPDQRT